EFERAREARDRAAALARRLPRATVVTAQLLLAEDQLRMALDEDWGKPLDFLGPGMGEGAVLGWYRAPVEAAVARLLARLARPAKAVERLALVIPAIERAAYWAENYGKIICDGAETIWLARATDFAAIIERNLLEKVIRPNLHHCMTDGRLALGRVCA